MSSLELISDIKENLEKNQYSYQSAISKIGNDDLFHLSASYQFLVKTSDLNPKYGYSIKTFQTVLVHQFAKFMGLKDKIFSVLNITDDALLSSNPFIKIGPFHRDSFGIIIQQHSKDVVSCHIVTKPFKTSEFLEYNSKILDFISQPHFHTSKDSRLRLRVMNPDLKTGFDPLAFAINMKDQNITSRFNNKFGNSGIEDWAAPFLSEQIKKAFLLEEFVISEDDNIHEFRAVLNSITEDLIINSKASFSFIDPERRFIDFFHIAGAGYENDLINITQSIFEVLYAIEASKSLTTEELWNDLSLKENLKRFIQDIYELKQQIEFFEFKERIGFKFKCYDIIDMATKFKVGTVNLINDTLDNSLLSVGGLNEFCLTRKEISIMAAILAKRF